MMRTVLALLLTTTAASAADQGRDDVDAREAVCRPFANRLLTNQMQWMFDRALNHCLNLLDDHPSPPARGDWRSALNILDPDHSDVGPSGYAPDTPEWAEWCAHVFPLSWRKSDGTIIFEPDNRGKRWRCPG